MATAIQVGERTQAGWVRRLVQAIAAPRGWSREREHIRFCVKRQSSLGRDAFISQWTSPWLRRMAAEEWDEHYPEVNLG